MTFSILIPSYNASKTILKTLDSILVQKFDDYEILIMDDGSTDNTIQLINDLNCEKIKVFTQTNSGPGMARNNLINKVQGEYIIFLDADDFLNSTFLEILQKTTSKSDADIIFINVIRIDQNGNYIESENIKKYLHLTKNELIERQLTGQIPWGAVRKVYKSSLIKNNNVRFLHTRVGEESIFSFLALKKANTFIYEESAIYYYVDTPNSLSKLIIKNQYSLIYEELVRITKYENCYFEYENALNTLSFIGMILNLRYAIFVNENPNIKLAFNEFQNKTIKFKLLNTKFKLLFVFGKLKLYFIVKKILVLHLNKVRKNYKNV